MNIWRDTYPIIISCAKGLVPATGAEVMRLGYRIIDSSDNTVVTRGSMRDMMELNLQLRTAHRVLVPLLRTECGNLRYLYKDIYSIDWENLLEADGYFTVSNVTRHESVRDTRMTSLVAKDAIVDRIRDKCGGRPDSGHENHGAAIFVYWVGREVIVYLDTTGEALSKRGYRKMPGAAPMQETLAAGCILSSGWDPATPFVAPMCGSGTPAIEAALIALDRAPGSFKSHFGFMSLKGYRRMIPGERAGRSVRQRFGATPEQIWKERVAVSRAGERSAPPAAIIASDVSQEALEMMHFNAIAAGVAEHITFQCADFAATRLPEPAGTLFVNPPYGERLDAGLVAPSPETSEDLSEPPAAELLEGEELAQLYQRLGAFITGNAAAYNCAVLSATPDLIAKMGVKPYRSLPFFNGPLKCRLLLYNR